MTSDGSVYGEDGGTVPVSHRSQATDLPQRAVDRKLGWRGRFSQVWTETPMSPGIAEDGCPCFTATVHLDEAEVGTRFRWGVRLDGPGAASLWAFPQK
jgi:hypothetical protein